MNLIRSIINFFGFNDAIVDGIGERGMRDSSIIRIYDKIKERTGLSTRYISRILNHTKRKDLRFI